MAKKQAAGGLRFEEGRKKEETERKAKGRQDLQRILESRTIVRIRLASGVVFLCNSPWGALLET